MITKILRTFLLPLLLIVSAAAEKGQIVYVDFDRVYRESKIVNAVREDIDVEFREREEALKKAGEDIAKNKEDLQKELLTLSEGEKEKRRRQIVELERDFARDRRALSEDLGLRFQERRRVIDAEISRLIKELAEEKGYRMILNPYIVLPFSGDRTLTHNVILYSDGTADITAEVIELFDEKAAVRR